jgi:hypothetical protein
MFDLNCNEEHLAFVVNGSNMYAKRANEETGRMEPITRRAFASIVEDVKNQCSGLWPKPPSICLCNMIICYIYVVFTN